ncbi:MAG: glutaredoxin family protein [Nitrospirae bacterium]|nr:glutaredoxin family protein [Nitrospirota bacterium]
MDVAVKLYTLSTCRACKSTKSLLDKLAVMYEFTDVDLLNADEQNTVLETIKAVNPRCAFPTVIIGETVIVGFQEKEIRKALGL